MAFRLRAQESASHGLRRLARTELGRARDELQQATPPSDGAIHEVRKRVKKVRAILQLVEADGGRRLARSRKRLRSVGRALSSLRDADAMLAIFAQLRRRNPRLFSEHTFARVRRRLWSRRRDAWEAAERDAVWRRIARDLRALRRDAKGWRPADRGFAALAAGIRAAHRRGRKAMARARSRRSAGDFHEWRKRMKALQSMLRLVEGASRQIRQEVAALRRAETALGDDHNLAVLCDELSKDSAVCARAADVDRLRLAVDRFQRTLRERASASAERIYARSSGAYLRRVKRDWKTWRRAAAGRGRRPRRTAA